MQELFQKYLDNQCSPTDLEVLVVYFNNPENEILLRRLIFESLEDAVADDEDSKFREATDRLFGKIEKKIIAEDAKVVPFSRKLWVRIVAAVIVAAGSFLLFNYFNNTSTDAEYATVETVTNEIGPGGNRAVVTLANGSTINLEKAINDTLAKEGSTSLVKLADGQLSYQSVQGKTGDNLYNSVATPRGGQYLVILSDGSKVWINAASSIHFPVIFSGKERVVELTGEAYFEVAKNKAMPFKVKMAKKAEVVVLGTHFDVNAYKEEPTINTTLFEGSVKVIGSIQNGSRIIVPGEQALLGENGRIEINKHADMEQVLAWKNGIFNFYHADLEMSLRQIARWYDVDIVFEGPIPKRKFNGEMQRTLNLSQVIKLLEKSEVYCRIDGKRLIVKS
jgi:transmembrane sensor